MRICIQFDECKPHWATQRGLPELAAQCGLRNILVTGDFDSKLTYIYGDTEDFELFCIRANLTQLSEGSIHEVRTDGV